MNEKLIRTITLKNRLILKIYDGSKRLAGDRWLISIIARIEIPVRESLLSLAVQATADEIRHALGEKVIFEQKRVRNFIDNKEKDETFKNLYDFFSANSLPYLSHPMFAEKYILKKYKEHRGKKAWPEKPDSFSKHIGVDEGD